MARKRKRRAARKSASEQSTRDPVLLTSRIRRIHLELTALEMASGYDGLLRGMPEPVILFGVFFVEGANLLPLGRTLIRFGQPEGRFPLVIVPTEPGTAELSRRVKSGANADLSPRIVILSIAIEEDAGTDIERVYAHLGGGRTLRVWDADTTIPSPATLAESSAGPISAPSHGARVNVLDDGIDLRDACKADDYIGASLLVLPVKHHDDSYRLHFVSADRRNDWTALVCIRLE